jgi:hypothetical protein
MENLDGIFRVKFVGNNEIVYAYCNCLYEKPCLCFIEINLVLFISTPDLFLDYHTEEEPDFIHTNFNDMVLLLLLNLSKIIQRVQLPVLQAFRCVYL